MKARLKMVCELNDEETRKARDKNNIIEIIKKFENQKHDMIAFTGADCFEFQLIASTGEMILALVYEPKKKKHCNKKGPFGPYLQ